MTKEEHPAMVAARSSWSCVHRKAREEWLGLMAENVVIEDPIGVSALDPTGKGHRGKQAAGAFWDRNIGPATIRMEPHESYAAGRESAHVITLTTSFPNGARMSVHGIFTYRLDDAGKIESLRGYWSFDEAKLEPPS